MTARLLSLVLLVLVYALTLGSFAWLDLLLGSLISGVLLLVFRPFLGSSPPARPSFFRQVVAFPPFASAVLRDILQGTWDVMLRVLHLRPLERPGLVTLPMLDRTPTGVAVSTLVMTLSPGSVLVDVDWEQRTMLFHVMDLADPEAFKSTYETLYRRYQQQVFP